MFIGLNKEFTMKKDFLRLLYLLIFMLLFFTFLSPSHAIPLLDDEMSSDSLRDNRGEAWKRPHEEPGPLFDWPEVKERGNKGPFGDILCIEEYGEVTCAGIQCINNESCELIIGVVSSPDDAGIGFGFSWGF